MMYRGRGRRSRRRPARRLEVLPGDPPGGRTCRGRTYETLPAPDPAPSAPWRVSDSSAAWRQLVGFAKWFTPVWGELRPAIASPRRSPEDPRSGRPPPPRNLVPSRCEARLHPISACGKEPRGPPPRRCAAGEMVSVPMILHSKRRSVGRYGFLKGDDSGRMENNSSGIARPVVTRAAWLPRALGTTPGGEHAPMSSARWPTSPRSGSGWRSLNPTVDSRQRGGRGGFEPKPEALEGLYAAAR